MSRFHESICKSYLLPFSFLWRSSFHRSWHKIHFLLYINKQKWWTARQSVHGLSYSAMRFELAGCQCNAKSLPSVIFVGPSLNNCLYRVIASSVRCERSRYQCCDRWKYIPLNISHWKTETIPTHGRVGFCHFNAGFCFVTDNSCHRV